MRTQHIMYTASTKKQRLLQISTLQFLQILILILYNVNHTLLSNITRQSDHLSLFYAKNVKTSTSATQLRASYMYISYAEDLAT